MRHKNENFNQTSLLNLDIKYKTLCTPRPTLQSWSLLPPVKTIPCNAADNSNRVAYLPSVEQCNFTPQKSGFHGKQTASELSNDAMKLKT